MITFLIILEVIFLLATITWFIALGVAFGTLIKYKKRLKKDKPKESEKS